MIKLIACIDKHNSIGINNDIIYRIKDDLRIFKEKTINNTVVMGRNTFKSIGNKPLPNRENIVLSRTLESPEDNSYIVLKSIDDVLNLKRNNNIYIIGGNQVYESFVGYYDEIHLSIIKDEYTINYDIDKATKLNVPMNNFELIESQNYCEFLINIYKRLS